MSEFWRTDDPVIENGVVVKGGMFERQREWWRCERFVKLLVAGYGYGKSLQLCKRIISAAIHNASIPVGVVSPTYSMFYKNIQAPLESLLDGKMAHYPQLSWSHRGHPHNEYRIRFGDREGVVWYFSGDRPERMKGPNLGAAYFDEAFLMDRSAFDQIIARVRHPESRLREIGLTGTPEELNWAFELAEGEILPADKVGVYHAATRDNLALPAEYDQTLAEAYDEKAQRAYRFGEFVDLSRGIVYHTFDAHRNVKAMEFPGYEKSELGLGMDFNVDPMAFVVFWWDGGHMHVIREYELPNSDTEEALTVALRDFPELRQCYPDPSGKQRSTAAPAGTSDYTLIRANRMQINAPPDVYGRRDSINAVNGALKRGSLTLSPQCRHLRRYMQQYAWERMNTEAHKRMSHLLDALRYPVANLMPIGGRPQVVSEVW